jgi:hypothetical protein
MKLFNIVNVVIQPGPTSQLITSHVDNLKKYCGSPPTDFTITNERDTVQPTNLNESDSATTPAEHASALVPERVNPPPTLITRSNRSINYNDYTI